MNQSVLGVNVAISFRTVVMRPIPTTLLGYVVLVAAGCGSGPDLAPVAPKSYDPEAMSKAAIQQLDKNGNGTLELAELEACPGLKAAFTNIDTNKDNKLSAAELKTRFEGYGSAGVMGFPLRVSLDGIPIADANVTLTPEAFMGGAVGEATGKTGPDGSLSNYAIGKREVPGLPSGVYRVAVTKDGISIPAKFNSQTTLGCEVSAGGRGGSSGFDVKLTSK